MITLHFSFLLVQKGEINITFQEADTRITLKTGNIFDWGRRWKNSRAEHPLLPELQGRGWNWSTTNWERKWVVLEPVAEKEEREARGGDSSGEMWLKSCTATMGTLVQPWTLHQAWREIYWETTSQYRKARKDYFDFWDNTYFRGTDRRNRDQRGQFEHRAIPWSDLIQQRTQS